MSSTPRYVQQLPLASSCKPQKTPAAQYEGIFTPVFRGSPWAVSKPHNYVLFEWDTYLSSVMSAVTDKWTAASNIVRMTKSLNYQGFVAGEIDSLVLQTLDCSRVAANPG